MTPDPRTFWLTVTNMALGLSVVLLVAGVATGVLCELVQQARKRRALRKEIDKDMKIWFHGPRIRR